MTTLIDQFTATEIGEYFFVPKDRYVKSSIARAAKTCRERTGRQFSFKAKPTMSGYRIYVMEQRVLKKPDVPKEKKRPNSYAWTNMFVGNGNGSRG